MIEGVDPFDQFAKRLEISGVRAISIAAGGGGRVCQPAVRNKKSLRCRPVCTGFDVVDLADGDMIKVEHVTTDMRKCRFLPEQVTATFYAMLQRNRLHGQTPVFIDHPVQGGINGMVDDFKT